MAFEDEYTTLLATEGIAECRERLRQAKEIVRYGRAGEPGRPSLFERELDAMWDTGEADREESGAGPPDLLLLTVGTSPEPLLLAVAYHAPRRVVLFIESHFPTDERRALERLWDHVHQRLGQPVFTVLAQRTVRDQPGSLFREVEAEFQAARGAGLGRVVLDFTGAKKTIVAGAFLAAGFLGIEATYVDFKRYDSTLNRPFPGSSFPAVVAHPVELFRLRERERLAQAFDAHRFEEAAALAGDLAEAAQSRNVRALLGDTAAQTTARRLERLRATAAAYAPVRSGGPARGGMAADSTPGATALRLFVRCGHRYQPPRAPGSRAAADRRPQC